MQRVIHDPADGTTFMRHSECAGMMTDNIVRLTSILADRSYAPANLDPEWRIEIAANAVA